MPRFELSRWFVGVSDSGASEPSDMEPRVRRAVDHAPVALFEIDCAGTYTCVAGGLIGVFGITPTQLIGRSIFEFPRFVPGKSMMVRRALAGESVSFTGIWPRGRFVMRFEPRRGADGRVTGVVGLGYELTRPAAVDKQIGELLEALRQSERRFRAVCESAPLGIYVSNSQRELSYVNPALCALLQRQHDELIGRSWESVSYRDEPQPDAARSEGVQPLARKDGSPVWAALCEAEMRDDAETLGYVGLVTDVTRERAARLASERARQDLRRMIECSPEGIAVVRNARWIFVNRALAEALGHARAEQLIGQPAGELVHPEDGTIAAALHADPHERTRQLRYRRADGEYALMEVRPAELSEFEGAPALLLAARDITEQKRLEAQSLATERLVSMGTLAASVAHELNNPLGALSSQLEWIEERLARVPEGTRESVPAAEVQRLAKAIAEAREAAARMRAIMRDLKLFSRPEDDAQVPVDLREVLDSAARMARNELRHRARFVRSYDDVPLIRGSEARLGQVFLNLLINAAQAIPEGDAGAHEVRLSARCLDSHEVLVEVRDSGCGIAPNILDRIFEPFFTTKPAGVGSGLGLSICKRIVTSMGGRIEVESELGRGSTFRVRLACARAYEHRNERTDAALVGAAPAGERGRVLVIDDDPAMASAIELVLADEHDVQVFTSAQRALARLRAGDSYDAIVCDVMMPGMSGMDFHAELAAIAPQQAEQIIFLTGGAFTRRAREFLDRTENSWLDKPFDSQSLRNLVSRRIARRARTSITG